MVLKRPEWRSDDAEDRGLDTLFSLSSSCDGFIVTLLFFFCILDSLSPRSSFGSLAIDCRIAICFDILAMATAKSGGSCSWGIRG